jgi:hypothetical protein
MANFFDQFDAAPAAPPPQGNFFDQFDAPVPPADTPPTGAQPGSRQYADWAAARAQTGAVLPQVSTPPAGAAQPPSMIDKIMEGANYVAETGANALYGARQGIGSTLGLPVDAINNLPRVANVIPGVHVGPLISEHPVGGSESLANLFSAGGIVPAPPEPTDIIQKGARRVGQEIGGAAVPGLGMAAKYGGIGVQAGRELPGLLRMFAEPYTVDAGKALGKDIGAATAAGMGATVANQVAPNNPWADAAGAIGGAGALGIGQGVMRSGSDIARALLGNGSFADEVTREAVMRDIASASGITARPNEAPDLSALVDAAQNGKRVSDTIPGFQDSLADRTKNPGIAALEYSRQSGPSAGVYAQQRAGNTQAIDAAMAPLEPQATPGAFREPMAAERDRRLGEASAATFSAQGAYDQSVKNLLPALSAEGRGANIRTALQDASDKAKQVLEQAWSPINGSREPVDMGALNENFGQVDQGLSVAERNRFRPAEASIPAKLIDPEDPSTTMQPLNEITGIRSALTDAQREALSSGRNNEARVIGQYVDGIDSYMDNNLPDDLKAQYGAARDATRDFHDRFTRPQTAIGQTLSEREGMPRYPDSSVAGKFVQSDQGHIADFEALMKEAGSDQRVQTGVRDQILQDVRDRGLLDKPQALGDYLGQYSTVFKKFPDLQAQLGDAKNLRAELDMASSSEQELRSSLTQQGKSNVANYLSYGDEKAEQAMKGVLASRDPKSSIDELLHFVGDEPKAVDGARKVFWDIMQGKSRAGGRTTMDVNGTQPWSPKALSDFLNSPTNSAVAERLYRDNPEHLARIHEIADALKGVDLRNSAKAPNTSGTTQGMSQLLTPETLQSRFYAYRSGKISGSFLVTSIVSVLVRRGVRRAQEQGYQRMMDDILTNADTAALLLKQNNPANRQALSRKAKLWFGNEASTILNSMSADDKPDDTTEAATRPH